MQTSSNIKFYDLNRVVQQNETRCLHFSNNLLDYISLYFYSFIIINYLILEHIE